MEDDDLEPRTRTQKVRTGTRAGGQVSGELGVAFTAIPALIRGGYTGAAAASSTIRHAILPLLSLPPSWFPKGPYVVVAVMYAAGFPGLYGYMLAQRKKVLRGMGKKK